MSHLMRSSRPDTMSRPEMSRIGGGGALNRSMSGGRGVLGGGSNRSVYNGAGSGRPSARRPAIATARGRPSASGVNLNRSMSGGGGLLNRPMSGGGALNRSIGGGGALNRSIGGGGALNRSIGGGGALNRSMSGGGGMLNRSMSGGGASNRSAYGGGGSASRTRSSGGGALNRSVYGGAPSGGARLRPNRVREAVVTGHSKARQYRRMAGREAPGDFSTHQAHHNPNSAIRMQAMQYDPSEMNHGR